MIQDAESPVIAIIGMSSGTGKSTLHNPRRGLVDIDKVTSFTNDENEVFRISRRAALEKNDWTEHNELYYPALMRKLTEYVRKNGQIKVLMAHDNNFALVADINHDYYPVVLDPKIHQQQLSERITSKEDSASIESWEEEWRSLQVGASNAIGVLTGDEQPVLVGSREELEEYVDSIVVKYDDSQEEVEPPAISTEKDLPNQTEKQPTKVVSPKVNLDGVPNWHHEGVRTMSRLWVKVLNKAREYGLDTSAVEALSEDSNYPSDLDKMARFHSMIDLLDKFDPAVLGTKNVREWLGHVIGNGVTEIDGVELKIRKDWATAREKQAALFVGRAKPAFTKLSEGYDHDDLHVYLQKLRELLRLENWKGSALKTELVDEEWNLNKYQGFFNPFYLACHSLAMAGGGMPWNSKPDPIPEDAVAFAADRVLYDELGFAVDHSRDMNPAHCLTSNSSGSTEYERGLGVTRISNASGAAGHPYTRIENARKLTSDGRRPTKGNTAQEEIGHIVKWIDAGLPMSGKLFERVAQPTTMTWRGDAQVHVELLALAEAMLRKGDPLLLWLLPGRGIAIVPGILTHLESIIADVLQWLISARGVDEWDLRTRRTTQSGMSGMISRTLVELLQALGLDVSTWDLNLTAQDHANDAGMMMRMTPQGEIPLLFGAASHPAQFTTQVVQELLNDLQPGESIEYGVAVPDPDTGVERTETVTVYLRMVNIHELICKTVSMVNGIVALGDVQFKGKLHTLKIPEQIVSSDMTDKDYHVSVRGTRRSGSKLTSLMNTCANGIVTYGGTYVLNNFRRYKSLINRHAADLGLGELVNSKAETLQSIRRGDDNVVIGRYSASTTTGALDDASIGSLMMAVTGRYANAKKQETSGQAGVPRFGFASKVYDKHFPLGLTPPARSTMRSITKETAGLPVSELKPLDSGEVNMDLGLVATTLTMKARLLPQRGGPMGDETPGSAEILRRIARLDRYGLTYGNLDKSDDEMANLVLAEARRYAKRESLRGSLTEREVKELESDYIQADMHVLLRQFFLVRDGITAPKKQSGAAMDWYEAKVTSLGP